MGVRIPLANFLKEKVQGLFIKPTSFRRDKVQNRHAVLLFQVPAKPCADNLPPALRQAYRFLQKVMPARVIPIGSSEENVRLYISMPPNGHDPVCIQGVTIQKPKVFRDNKTGELHISFQAAIDPSKNTDFTMKEFGKEVMLSAESSPELVSAEEELPDAPDQKDIDFPEVPADPKKRAKKVKSVGKVKGKPGATLPRSLGIQRKPLPKPKDKPKKRIKK